MQSADGYYRILGRIDDVINVAGHRLGTKEIESACLTVPEVAEAAVVPVMDELRGRLPEVYVVAEARASHPARRSRRRSWPRSRPTSGRSLVPRSVWIVPDMPKTRSGKIMRRVLASISNTMAVGDITTLANPDVVEQIRVNVQGSKPVTTKQAPADIRDFGKNE